MAEVKISALPSGTVTATDIFPGVQSSTTKKFTVADALALAWPVGSVFIAVVSTNPNTLLGFGTWSAFGTGRTLVGIDTGDPDFDVVEETGGAKTVTLAIAEIPAHTHTQDAHTHTQDAHTHTQDAHLHQTLRERSATTGGATTQIARTADTTSTVDTAVNTENATATNQNATAINQNATATNQNTGGGGAHANVQPYIVVYLWKRTA